MRYVVFILSIFCFHSKATSYHEPSLKDLYENADTVIKAKVLDVDAIDFNGEVTKNTAIRTGLGYNHMIRIHIEPVRKIKSKYQVPKHVTVNLDPNRILTLGTYRELVLNKSFIFFLEGEDFQSVTPGFFMQLPDKEQALLKIAE